MLEFNLIESKGRGTHHLKANQGYDGHEQDICHADYHEPEVEDARILSHQRRSTRKKGEGGQEGCSDRLNDVIQQPRHRVYNDIHQSTT